MDKPECLIYGMVYNAQQQMVQTLIRLLSYEQSDLGLHCWLPKLSVQTFRDISTHKFDCCTIVTILGLFDNFCFIEFLVSKEVLLSYYEVEY